MLTSARPRSSSGAGLHELLTTLGHKPDGRARLGLVALFFAVTLSAALAAEWMQRAIALPFAVWHALLWLCWLGWHSLLFPRARDRALRSRRDRAYRAVFGTHIVPGVCIGVGLMGGPALHAVVTGAPLASPASMAVALVLVGCGTALLAGGFAAIGFASAGFLFEYVETSEPIIARGVYRHIRHPLFLGGVIASVGAALVFADAAALTGAVVNLVVLPVYMRLEDRRLSGVFGDPYITYSREIAAFVPKGYWRRLFARSAPVER